MTYAAEGQKADTAKPMKDLGAGVYEIAVRFRTDAYRVVYAVQISHEIWVVHAFSKEIDERRQKPETRNRCDPLTDQTAQGDTQMTGEFEIVRGSGNVFRDLGHANADVEQAKALLAAEIVAVLDARELSTRKAEALSGIDHAEFARIRNAKLDRFTIDRLVIILNRLGQQVDVGVSVRPEEPPGPQPGAGHP